MKNLFCLFTIFSCCSIGAVELPVKPVRNETIRQNGEASSDEIKITPFGYIKADNFFDTRQVLGFQENESLFFPLPKVFDKLHRDINAHPQAHSLAIETTFGLELSPVEISPGIKAKAFIEAFFVGTHEININHYTAYRNYLQLETDSWELLTGLYWHPLFVDDCYPQTISFSNGTPIDSQDWEPQIRYTYKKNNWRVSGTILSELDSTSLGPRGYSSEYLSNSATPNINLFIKRDINKHFIGMSGDYRRIAPRIVTDTCYKTNETVSSFTGAAFASLRFERSSVRLKCIYSQNGAALSLISGYGIRTEDPITNIRTYSPTSAICAWIDTDYTFTKQYAITVGCFMGYTQNLGSSKELCLDAKTKQPIIYAFYPQIAYDFKFMPRLVLKIDPVDIGFELEFDRAAFGKLNNFGKPINTRPVSSVRLLFAAYYRY